MGDSKARIIESLRNVPLFADLTEPELGFLADRALSKELQAGEMIFLKATLARGCTSFSPET